MRRILTACLVASLVIPMAATALPGFHTEVPLDDAATGGVAVEAGPVKRNMALLLLPGTKVDNPLAGTVGPDAVRTTDTTTRATSSSQGTWIGASDATFHLPIPLLPDGVLYLGVGTFRDENGMDGRFADHIILVDHEMPRIATANSEREAPALASLTPRGTPEGDARLARDETVDPGIVDGSSPTKTETGSTFAQTSVALDRPALVTPATALAAGLGLSILSLLGIALYHRIRANATLDNDTRKMIFDAVCNNPGMGVQEVADSAKVSYSTATYHLDRLSGAGMLVMTPDGKKLRYYKNGGTFTENERRILPILRNAEAARLLEAIAREPGTYRTALATRLGVTTTTVNWHLKRLREAGLIDETRQGRSAFLSLTSHAAQALDSLASKLDSDERAMAATARRCTPAGA